MKFTTIRRDYLTDVLPNRKNAVSIEWNVFDNSNMVKEFGYEATEMENFKSMLSAIEDGEVKEAQWLEDFIRFYFERSFETATKANRKIRKAKFKDDQAATIMFVPVSNDGHKAIKKVVERVLGNSYLVKVIDGDETTNAQAEKEARQAIADVGAANVIFITSTMANRSWSVPEVKNVILLVDGVGEASLKQKIARGFTPWNDKHQTCYITDIRLGYNNKSCLESYLSSIAVNTLEETAQNNVREVLSILEASDKITFNEYFTGDNKAPFRKLTEEEVSIMLHSSDYTRANASKVIYKVLDEIDSPKVCKLNEKLNMQELISPNFKGDADKKIMVKTGGKNNAKAKKEDIEKDARIQHLAFLLNHFSIFNSGAVDKDILRYEFSNMTNPRAKAYEQIFGIDMKVMNQIAQTLIKANINLDNEI